MKNRLFYVIISVFTAVISLTGCEGTSLPDTEPEKMAFDSSAETRSTESTQKSSETSVSTLTPLQTFQRMWQQTDSVTETEEAAKKNTEQTEVTDSWFSEHALFEMKLKGYDGKETEAETTSEVTKTEPATMAKKSETAVSADEDSKTSVSVKTDKNK